MSKNIVLIRVLGGLVLLMLATGTAPAQDGKLPPLEQILSERAMGPDDAPVTVMEFASLTCPHCASFHAETLPALKKDYIDPGKVRLVYRDFPLDRLAMTASMMARCAPPERYFGLLEILFSSQRSWAGAPDPAAALARIGRLAGMSQETIEACLASQPVFDGILRQRSEAEEKFNIESTPSFVLNGRKLSGDLPLAEFRKELDAALANRN